MDQLLNNENVALTQLSPYIDDELTEDQMKEILIKIFRIKSDRAEIYVKRLLKESIESLNDLQYAAMKGTLNKLELNEGDINRIDRLFKQRDEENSSIHQLQSEHPENVFKFSADDLIMNNQKCVKSKDSSVSQDDDYIDEVDGDGSDSDTDGQDRQNNSKKKDSKRPAPKKQGKHKERVQSIYRKECDTYDQDQEDDSVYFVSDFVKIGPGRIGAYYADMYRGQCEFFRQVALKCTDEDKCPGEVKEIRNEGRVLYYAKKLGLKCTPDIYFSGPNGPYYANLTELLREEHFYNKKLQELDLQEQQLFRAALIELASNGIKHNDIRSRHVFFAKDLSRCVIIDYGCAKIIKKQCELELEFEFDESLGQLPSM